MRERNTPQKHGERNDEIDGVEDGSIFIHRISIGKIVVRELWSKGEIYRAREGERESERERDI